MVYRAAALAPTRLTVAARSARGLWREVNEDSFLVLDLADPERARRGPDAAVEEALESDAPVALVVLDGMGGSCAAVDVVRIALEGLELRLVQAAPPEGHEALRRALGEAVQEAGRAILKAAQRDRRLTGCGAVATAAAVAGGRAHLAHAGDTRAYLWRAGRLAQLTRDDTLINDGLDHGLSKEELEQLPRNIITKGLGFAEEVTLSGETVELSAGDVLLLCSDGVHGAATDAALGAVLRAYPEPADACAALVAAAEGAGSYDNITALVARVDGAGAEAEAGAGAGAGVVCVAAREAAPYREERRDRLVVMDLGARERRQERELGAVLPAASGVVLCAIRGEPPMAGPSMGQAAERAADAFCAHLLAAPPPASDEALRGLLAGGLRAMADAAREMSRTQPRNPVAVQATAAVIAGDRLHLAHVGTGRAYLRRRGRLVQLTRDDTLINDAAAVASARAQGMCEEAIAEMLEQHGQGVLTRVLGWTPGVEPALETVALREDDVLLLCTEGLPRAASDAALEALFRDRASPGEVCYRLLMDLNLRASAGEEIVALAAAVRGPGLRPAGEEDALASRNQPA